jgi:predicted DNA-binding transcriptional regulator AlpA
MIFNQSQEPKKRAQAAGAASEPINPDPLFDTSQAAAYLNSSEPSLERYRALGAGPRWIKMGGSVRYRRSDLDAYITACTREPRRAARRRMRTALRSESAAEAR